MEVESWIEIAAISGAALSMGLGAIGAAVGEGYTAARANEAIGRSPDKSGDIFKNMLVGEAIAETAAIFSLLVAMMLLFTDVGGDLVLSAFVLFSAGICMGFGAIGSGIGSGLPAGESCIGIDRQPEARNSITTNMLIGSSIAQTPAILALATALILLFSDFSAHPVAPTWAAIIGAGIAGGVGAIGSAIGEGLVAQAACEGIARKPQASSRITNIMFLGMAVSETTAIYGLLIAMILIFKKFAATADIAAACALLGAGLSMGIGAIGPGIGEGLTGSKALQWIARNDEETPVLTRTMLVGQAVSESTGIYALVIAFVMIFVV